MYFCSVPNVEKYKKRESSMKKYIFVFLSVCSLLATMSAKENGIIAETSFEFKGTYEETSPETSPFEFELTQGWRQDRFKASHNAKGVPFKKHARLKDVKIYETRIRMQGSLDNFFLRVDGGYGMVLKSSSKFSALGLHGNFGVADGITGGTVRDIKASFGGDYYFDEGLGFFNETTSISPMIGYIGGREKIKFGKGRRLSLVWQDFFVGLDFKKELYDCWSIYAEYDFACIPVQKPKGYGHIGILGVGYCFTENIALKAEFELSNMKVHYSNRHRHDSSSASRTSSTGRLVLNLAV